MLARQWRLVLRALLLAVPIAALLVLALWRRRTLLEAALHDWAVSQVAETSDSVYHLSMGKVHLSVVAGRIEVDALRLVTDTSRNDFRATPLPVLAVTATGCRVLGIDVWQMLMARGLIARLFRCDDMAAVVQETVRDTVSAQPAAADARRTMPFIRDSIALPSLLPGIVVHGTELPRLSLDYTRRGRGGATAHVTLQRLSIQLRETRIDPGVRPRDRKPLFSEQAIVTATTLDVVRGANRSVALGRLHANLTDSTLSLDSVVVGPPTSDADWLKAQDRRRDLIRFHLDSARLKGVDYRRLGGTEGAIIARRAQMYGFRLDVLSDKRLPAAPPHRRRTPQQWVAALDRPLGVDTLIISGGMIAYREHAVGRDGVGTMTWEQLEGQVTDIRTVAPAGTAIPAMVVRASALLQGKGRLEATIDLPLTAPHFDMKYSGTLGPMDITAVNALMERTMNARVARGSLRSVRFSIVVRDGRSAGQVVPLYSDFKVQLEDKDGSFLKKAGLSVASLFANAFKVRGNNPGGPGKKPVVGIVRLPYRPTASLPQVFWFALREGLKKVFLK